MVTGLDPETGSMAGAGSSWSPATTSTVAGSRSTGPAPRRPGSPQRCSSDACVVTVPPHTAGDVPVVVTTHAGSSAASAAATYSYVRAAASGGHGHLADRRCGLESIDNIIISGHNLDGGEVFFGGVKSFNADCTSSECTMPYPPQPDDAGTVDVTVQTAGGTSATGPQTRFTRIRPTVTSVSPATGWTDGTTQVTITGTTSRAA